MNLLTLLQSNWSLFRPVIKRFYLLLIEILVPDVPEESKPVEVKQVEQPEEVAPQGNLTFVLDVQEILVTMPSTISNTKDTPNVLAFRGKI